MLWILQIRLRQGTYTAFVAPEGATTPIFIIRNLCVYIYIYKLACSIIFPLILITSFTFLIHLNDLRHTFQCEAL